MSENDILLEGKAIFLIFLLAELGDNIEWVLRE